MTLHDNPDPLTLSETTRARLIADIASVLRAGEIPSEARAAGLTLIGWLARRLPEDPTVTAPHPPTP